MTKEFFLRLLSAIILFPLMLIVTIEGSIFFFTLLFLCFVCSLYEWNNMTISKYVKILGFIFLIFSFYTILKIRINYDNNYWPFLIIIFVCIATDIGGYIFGKIFKGPKLIKISPNKTFSGMIGSFLLSFLLCFTLIYTKIVNKEYIFNFIIFIFFVSMISQLGDILISYFKRLSNIKDTGNIIPGHGGLLDRIDGMIFAFPFSYIILLFEYFDKII